MADDEFRAAVGVMKRGNCERIMSELSGKQYKLNEKEQVIAVSDGSIVPKYIYETDLGPRGLVYVGAWTLIGGVCGAHGIDHA